MMEEATYPTFTTNDTMDLHDKISRYLAVAFSALAICANVLVLAAFGKIPGKLNPHLLLIVNLTVADLLVAISAVVNRLDADVFSNNVYANGSSTKFVRSLVYGKGFRVGTYLILMFMAIDHYVAVIKPLQYRRLITRKKTFIAISIIWVVSALVHFSQHFLALSLWLHPEFGHRRTFFDVFKLSKRNLLLTDYIYLALLIVGLVLMSVTYLRIFLETRKSLRLVESLTPSEKKKKTKNWYATITSLLILATFLVCYVPYCVTKTARQFLSDDEAPNISDVHPYLAMLRTANSFCDPVIYALRLATIKKGIIALYTPCRHPNTTVPRHGSCTQEHSLTDTADASVSKATTCEPVEITEDTQL